MMNQQHQKQYPGQRQGQGRPITVRDAVLFTKRLCRDQGGGRGIVTLWSGYQKSAMTLLPYTAVYFAAYEKLKQLVRYYDLHGHGQRKDQQQRSSNKNGASTILLEDNNTSRSSSSSSREYSLHLMASTPTPLNLGTYMACVVGAVAISATLCHTASVVKSHLQRQMGTTASSFMSGIANRVSASSSSSSLPVSTTATPTTTHTTTAAITRPGGPLQFFLPPQHQHQQQQLQQLQQLQQQHAHLTTTTANYTSATTTTTATATSMDARVMSRRTKLLPCQKVTKNNNITSYAFLRTLTRGLGPRIMWTAPGVALTTAGFEVFRNMALGVV
ncbi:hypothetical protein BG004_003392 [Podila humilis]|nr:hypothetical protein BG004_003392 [Podila humilis]